MMRRLMLAVAIAVATGMAQPAAAQLPPPDKGLTLGSERVLPLLQTEGPWGSTVGLEVFDRIRGEFVDWFATPPTSATPNFRYNFMGNKFQLGLRIKRAPYEVFVQFQDSTLVDVPSDAVGVGSVYYANTKSSLQNGAILRNAWAQTTRLGVDGLFIKGGRMLYSNAADAVALDPRLAWLQTNRLSQRLIGPFDYTHIGRSFDGGRLGYDGGQWQLSGFGFKPTFGGYEVDANRELDINLAGAALDLKTLEALGGLTIGQLAYYYYDDFRDVVFLDNRPLPVRQADQGMPAHLSTIGANVVHVHPLGPGFVDAVAYGYGQFGEWQSLDQESWAYGVETGYRLTSLWAAPWLRVGINSASGDTNPNDGTHGTFFQMLPTAWLYAQFPFYNMMNNQDVLAQLILNPHPRVSFRLDFHWLRVNSANDLVYSGGGATKNDLFGYAGLPTNGRDELAYLTHFLLSASATQNLTFNFFYAHAWGQGIINSDFTGTAGNYGYIETIFTY
jgi:hypothetical protein